MYVHTHACGNIGTYSIRTYLTDIESQSFWCLANKFSFYILGVFIDKIFSLHGCVKKMVAML